MSRVVEASAVVGDSQFLNLFHGAGIFDCDRGIIAERLQEKLLFMAEVCHIHIYELDDPQHAELRPQGNADD